MFRHHHHLLLIAKLALVAGAALATAHNVNGPKYPRDPFNHVPARPVIVVGAR